MKKHLTKLSLALLSAVFILGCQDQGFSPVEPVDLGPAFDKKGSGDCAIKPHNLHCHGDPEPDPDPPPTFTVTFDGDITGEGVFLGQSKGVTEIFAPVELAQLSLDFSQSFQGKFVGGVNCFGEGLSGERGNIDQERSFPLRFRFIAKDKNGDGTDIFYLMVLNDAVFTPATPWPPEAPADTTTITGGIFELQHENGPGRKNACKANGDLLFSITVTKN